MTHHDAERKLKKVRDLLIQAEHELTSVITACDIAGVPEVDTDVEYDVFGPVYVHVNSVESRIRQL